MQGKKKLFLLAAALVLLLGGAYGLYRVLAPAGQAGPLQAQPAPAQEPDAGQPQQFAAPDFTVQDAQGQQAKLSDFAGKPVVLNFWASWCGPCQGEMPDFDAMYGKWGGQVQFLMVNMTDGVQETVQSAQDYVQGEGFSFPVYFDTQLEAAAAYSVRGIPATYFIDAQGNLVARALSAISQETIEEGISMILPAQ